MGQDPSDIREEIEDTREEIEDTRARMGDTVEAIGYKTDVKSRAKESVSGKVGRVKSKLTGAGSRIGDATPEGGDVKQGARQAVGVAQENPLGLAIGGVAVGFLAGMLIPTSSVEDERLGPMADQVKDRAKDTGQEALERGKQVAQEAAQSAKETAQESGRQQAEELRSNAEQRTQEVREQA